MPTSLRTSRRTRKPKRKRITSTLSSVGRVDKTGVAVVCGVEYEVLEGEDILTHNVGEDEPMEVRGAVNPYTGTIILDRALGKSQKELTLLHELIHAIDDSLDIGLSEKQTGLLGAGLYGLTFKGPRKRDKTRTVRGLFYG